MVMMISNGDYNVDIYWEIVKRNIKNNVWQPYGWTLEI